MKCSPTEKILQLYREGDDKCLLELRCGDMSLNKPDPRLHLNTSSGCWTLTDAQKNDSGVYIIRRHDSKGKASTTLLNITVLDPGPSPGKIAAHSPGRIAAYVVAVAIILSLGIFLSVKYRPCNQKNNERTKDVERNGNNDPSEEHCLNNSSSDRR